MPLDADGKGMFGHFHGFDNPIRSKGHRFETGSYILDTLMVEAVDIQARLTQYFAETAACFDAHGVRQRLPRQDTIAGMIMHERIRNLIRDVGVQAAAQGHIDNLQAPANPQEGFAPISSGTGKTQFDGIPGPGRCRTQPGWVRRGNIHLQYPRHR